MENKIKDRLFAGVDFKGMEANESFKEDSVREVIIMPLLKELGYKEEDIERSKALKHPYLKIGSQQKRVTLVPDYLLKVGNNYAWVLDAKSPKEKIINSENVEQVYSYATHPEIRTTYFALCNGREFAVFRTNGTNTPVLYFSMDEVDIYFSTLKKLLSQDSFQTGKQESYTIRIDNSSFDYLNRPLPKEIKVRKRATKRHFGVHGYFTKQSWDIVQTYIKNFTLPGDLVLDPFGGSGVTAIEAMMTNRRAINIDLNPMAIFLVEALVAPVDEKELTDAFEKIKKAYLKGEPKTKKEIREALRTYPQIESLPLPKDSDVETVDKLFSDKQKAQLSFLKHLIYKYYGRKKDINIRKTLLLMFSGLVTKINLTYHNSSIGGGDAAAFRYYRYRIAPKPTSLDVMYSFELRFKKVLDAKKEIRYFINKDTLDNLQIVRGSATDLSFIETESVDYIYTDPPYGNKIPYLDLSAMWNAWLDLEVTERDYKQEAIEGGTHNQTKETYKGLIAESIKEMYRVLKFDRWMSFVFAHKDPEFWHLIVETAEACGLEYVGAVPQKNGQTSFKKRQNPFTVLSGQLIINFRKARSPKAIMKAHLGMDIADIVMQTIEGIIAKNNGATLEQINDELIIKGLELGFLDLLKKEYTDLTPILTNNFDYDEKKDIFLIKKNSKFTTHIDLNLRIRYYLISFLRRMEREHRDVSFDEIIMDTIPLLKNGVTPEDQTVLTVLENIADRTSEGKWRLKTDDSQLALF
ncbi:MAG: DNA methyltransferase [Bacteroidota bacterium]|nr:DNA methyltransferase [Bacteroidota bacterium]